MLFLNSVILNTNICANESISRLIIILGIVLNIIKILVPIIIIIMGIKDYFYASVNSDKEAIIKASKKLGTRIIAGIIIFFIPTIVSFGLSLIDDEDTKSIFADCTKCLLDVSECNTEIPSIKEENTQKEEKEETKEETNKEEEKEETKEETEEETNKDAPTIEGISKDGVLVTISAKKNKSDIAGYYFSYTNELPDKTTGGYIATSDDNIELVRILGTTYVWVEDKDGNISEPQTVSVDSSDILVTSGDDYTMLKGTTLESYLESHGSSIQELDNLMARSVRAAGLYSKEAVATSALSFTQTLARKYKIKIPYQSAGLRTVPGAKPEWGGARRNPKADNEKYYGLDCSAFANWVYANAGFGVNSRVYYWGNSIPRVAYSKENGDIGDIFVYGRGNQKGRHVKVIVGKTDTEYITAEATGSGVVVRKEKFKEESEYEIQKADFLIDVNKNKDYYLNTDYPTGN